MRPTQRQELVNPRPGLRDRGIVSSASHPLAAVLLISSSRTRRSSSQGVAGRSDEALGRTLGPLLGPPPCRCCAGALRSALAVPARSRHDVGCCRSQAVMRRMSV